MGGVLSASPPPRAPGWPGEAKRAPRLLPPGLRWKRLAGPRRRRRGERRRGPGGAGAGWAAAAPGPGPGGSPPAAGRVVVAASTGELLQCLGRFLCRRCPRLKRLSPAAAALWLRAVDRALLLQGWQETAFVTPANLVFVYLLCREAIDGEAVRGEAELRAALLTCLYLAYSYLGHEISYPLKPFLAESSREAFWARCLRIADATSAHMLRLNADPRYFTQVFADLKAEGRAGPPAPSPGRACHR